tara:strand:- start:10896 stop:11060 length:165 start_codon:yes stop_codon:yes gene_type:complete
MEQVTDCFAKLEGLEFLFKVFDSCEEGVSVWNGTTILFFQYVSIERIVVRERLI